MGAKNHAIIMPDAEKDDAINAIIGACFGSTGQRCMAISVAVMVGDSAEWIPEIVERTRKLTTGPGKDNYDIAPLINPEAKVRVENMIEKGAKEGAKILLDGRGIKVLGYENGNFVGPTVIDHARPGMSIYDDEIFGPVMVIVRVKTL